MSGGSFEWFIGFVPVKAFRVVEVNGDLDGYPDTNETVDVFVTVHNPARSVNLTNVVVHLGTTDPKIDCILTTSASIASLPAGADAQVPFRLHVHPAADRAGAAVICTNPGPDGTCSNFVQVPGGCSSDGNCQLTPSQDYSAKLNVSTTSDQYPGSPRPPQVIALDIDLNSNTASAPTTTFTEGFEAGFGAFQFQNLDDNKASNSASDGYRCQYTDPDVPGSFSYGETSCYLGFAQGQSPVNEWHLHGTSSPDGGRAFLGTRSIHYGKHTPGNPTRDTYGLSQLDTIRTKSSIHLAARVCRDDPAPNKRSCNSGVDCLAVGGGPCVSANPELSFKHQVSLVDGRAIGMPDGHTVDRAVAEAQLAASGIWEKLYPFENVYNDRAEAFFVNCIFDPIDDGNNEDSYFAPTDPNRPANIFRHVDPPLGPSSTCFPELAFSALGDTDEPFDPSKIESASDGPGLPGAIGIGTWVESRFDLSRFRGRSVRIRFLLTSVKAADLPTWAYYLMSGPWDDGWYIDDVRVTQTLGAASPTVSLDNADNGALPGNMDEDARGDQCDCAPANPGAFAIPAEVRALMLAADKATVTWESAAPRAGSDTVHDVLRGALDELPVGSGLSEACLASAIQGATAFDSAMPADGSGFWYLVRGRNVCGIGTYGFQSDGTERTSSACP